MLLKLSAGSESTSVFIVTSSLAAGFIVLCAVLMCYLRKVTVAARRARESLVTEPPVSPQAGGLTEEQLAKHTVLCKFRALLAECSVQTAPLSPAAAAEDGLTPSSSECKDLEEFPTELDVTTASWQSVGVADQTGCAICLSEFEPENAIRRLVRAIADTYTRLHLID